MKVVIPVVAICLGLGLACSGCGSGVTVMAMQSPTISGVSPQVVTAGTPSLTLTVKGANFDSSSAVMLNGTAVPTSMVSSDTLAAQVGAAAIAQPVVAQLKVQNSRGVTSNAVNFTVATSDQRAANPQLSISTTSLVAAAVGTPYSATLAATGGTPAYTWSVTAGTLPAGLSLSSAGVLSGTATTAGTSTFTAEVKDSSSPELTQSVTLSLVVAPAVTTAAPLSTGSVVFAPAQVGVAYTATVNASGGTPGYTWWISSGNLPAGLTLSSAGVISGTPTASGVSNLTISVNDSSTPQQTLSQSASISVSPSSLTIVTSSLPTGSNSIPYSTTLVASGGTPGYLWSLAGGKLPTGLTLSSNGVISGIPTSNGNYKIDVSVQDSGSPAQAQSASLTLHVSGPAFSINSTMLASGVVGATYSTALSASGGTPGYTWAIGSGSLPAGLTLSNSGVISGTPTTLGSFNFVVTATDSSSPAMTIMATEAITVSASQLAIVSGSLPAAKYGSSYAASLSASGGTPAYTWSIASGSLPAGLTLSSTGVISGTPSASGTSTFTVAVVDSSSPALTATASESITVGAAPLTILSTSLAAGKMGSAYSASLAASGGTPSYTWSVASGSLPAGLTLSSTGVISGTPSASGTSTFTVAVKDSSSPALTATASESITVGTAQLTILSTSLAAGKMGSAYSASLAVSGGTASYTWSIASGSLPAGLTLSSTGVISGTPSATGTSTFTVAVKDSSSPALTATASESITVGTAQLTILSTSLAAGKMGSAYSASLAASGGTPSYTWSITAGSLPAGLTLSSTGVISGTPSATGSYAFTVTVKDSSSPVQTVSATESIFVSGTTTSLLSITSSSVGSAQVGVAYSATLQASGGTGAYTWTVTSGSLPVGLTLSASTGIISGTPTTSGTSSFSVQVADSSSPVQTQSAAVSIPVAVAQTTTSGTTWYVRPDGGTRYSASVATGQCDGKGDAAYPGSGTNQHCAFKDVRYLWTDGTYCTDNSSTSTCWKWIGSGGDTYIIRGSISDGVSYRIGQNGPNSGDYFGLAGNPYGAGIPKPLSGTSSQHTRILGGNYASCSAQTSRTQLHGGYGVSSVLNMSGVSYVDLQCLDITDFSSCGQSGQTNKCNTNFPLSDYATNGISWANTSRNDTLNNVRIHGLGATGMLGPTGNGVVMTGLDLIGNGGSGWNADDGDGTTGTGTLLVQNYNVSWNGCAEEYPLVDPLPYKDCADDNSGGYGDGFGTATVPSNPGWQITFDQGTVAYNTQDGLDGLHSIGVGSSMTVTRTLAYGNMGQQIKVGSATTTAINNVIITNCNAMRQAIPGTPSGYNSRLSDFCRAADTGVAMTVGKGTTARFQFNTVYSASATTIEVDCDFLDGACDSTSLIDFRNNIFVGFMNNTADGYPSGGTGNYANPVYVGAIDEGYPNPFLNTGSVMDHNLTYHAKSNWACPATSLHETNALCTDPQLTDETWHLYGYGSAMPLSSTTVVQGAGIAIPSVTTDYTGVSRGNPPSMGAYE